MGFGGGATHKKFINIPEHHVDSTGVTHVRNYFHHDSKVLTMKRDEEKREGKEDLFTPDDFLSSHGLHVTMYKYLYYVGLRTILQA